MKRGILIAKGRVQRVGYRDLVADWAVDLGVVGFVENQPDERVKIVVEGEEGILEEFIRKAQPEDDPLIRITQVDVNYEKATGEFEHFKIKRGSSEEETAERLDTAAKSLKELIKTTAMMNKNLGNKLDAGKEETISTIKSGNEMLVEKQDMMLGKQDETISTIKSGNEMLAEKQDQMLGKQDETISIIKSGNEMLAEKQDMMIEKQDQMLGKQDETIAVTKSGVDETREFREETQQNFATMDTKYGKIAENMERILEELKEERKEYRESVEKLVAAIIESRKQHHFS